MPPPSRIPSCGRTHPPQELEGILHHVRFAVCCEPGTVLGAVRSGHFLTKRTPKEPLRVFLQEVLSPEDAAGVGVDHRAQSGGPCKGTHAAHQQQAAPNVRVRPCPVSCWAWPLSSVVL